jgi:hypothetical protein
MGVIDQGKEKVGRKNVQRIMQNKKTRECKKRPYKVSGHMRTQLMKLNGTTS